MYLTHKEKREKMTVYGDLLFLINFSMDFLCFYISSMLLHQRLPLARACAASALGGIYAVAVLFLRVGKGTSLLIDVGCCLLICTVVFCRRGTGMGALLKATAIYFFVSMLLGGVMTGLFSLFNRSGLFSESDGSGNGITVWIFAALAVAGGSVSCFGGRFFRSSSGKREVVLELFNEGESVRLRALSDSGNLVRDPISGRALIIATLSSSRKIIPKGAVRVFENVGNIDSLSASDAASIRLIPAGTVSGNTILPAIRVKKIRLVCGKKKKDIDALISFVDRDSIDGYDAIIPDEIMP